MSWGGRDRPTRTAEDGPRLRVALLDPDPYLALLVEQEFPDGELVEYDGATPASALLDHDLVVGRDGDERLRELLGHDRSTRPRVVVAADGRTRAGAEDLRDFDAVLLRPFTPSEVGRTLRAGLGLRLGSQSEARSLIPDVERWLGTLRVAGVVVAAVVELSTAETPQMSAVLLAIAFLYVAVRGVVRRNTAALLWGDVAVTAALVAASGGVSSPYTVLAAVVAVEAGLLLGRLGALAAATISLAAVPELVVLDPAPDVSASQLGTWLAAFPLAALTSSLAADLWSKPGREGAELLSEANRVLSSLYEIARAIPGGFEKRSVASAAVDEVRHELKAPAALLLVEEVGLLSVVASYGVKLAATPVFEREELEGLTDGGLRIVPLHQLPHRLRADLPEGIDRWACAPLEHGGSTVGMLLVAWDEQAFGGREDLDHLARLAEQAALALANAHLFSRVRELSVDAERRRLAAELHDGIAQVLAHVRLELDLLAAGVDVQESVRQDAQRLGRVVQRGLLDVRSTITGLRSSVTSEGLPAALRDYIRDLQGLVGPNLVLRARTPERLPPDVEADLFRVAQEALSNALRHAEADEVTVTLASDADAYRLVVEDDGRGLQADAPPASGRGLGLRAMLERAERIGASLTISERPSGGTEVALVYPLRGSDDGVDTEVEVGNS